MKSPISTRVLSMAIGMMGVALAIQPAMAQSSYPTRPIELVVPFTAGGGTDVLARAFGEAMRKQTGQTILVVNKPGASGAVGLAEVIGARPDGYKLAMMTGELTALPHLGIAKFKYDDLEPVVRLNADPSALTVRADAPWKTVEEFLATARERKGDLRVGNAGNGSIWHLSAAALEDKTGTRFNHIPFGGGGPAVLALVGGHIDAVTVSPAEVSAQIAAGKLKMLAVMSDKRFKGFEKVPTLKERGIDLSIGNWRGVGAPKGTPPQILNALVAASTKSAQDPGLIEALDKMNLGASFADPTTFRADIANDNIVFGSLIGKLGIKN